ncbi:MAG: DUF3450 domain-containing protein, partial [Propionibacteriaceae bacterium]|nr:DUF3450 domain-containing protein [Propionibacteriaceae bacterium]
MSRLSRPLVALCATALAAGLCFSGQAPAQADRLSDAQEQLTQLQAEAAEASEQFNQVQAQLDAATSKLVQDQQTVKDQQAKVESLRQQIAVISLQQFQDRGITSATALFTAEDQDAAIDKVVLSSMVAETTQAILQNYELSQSALAEAQRSAQATVDAIAADKQRQAD